MGAEGVNFTVVRSDYVLILAALVCALICAIGLAVVARCVCFHRRFNVSMDRTRSHPPPATPPPGLNKKLLEFLPASKYDCRVGVGADKQTECVVCLTEFADGDMTRILPQCGHVFHVPCIDTWLKSHSTCPSCRTVVLAVARCRHCGQFTERQGLTVTVVGERGIDMSMMSRQDCAHRFLPLGNPIITP